MEPDSTTRLTLSLDGFEGPLDLLLELARAQKFDLSKVSIVTIVDQFLAVIEGAAPIRLELAADWLVMAAWLAWLKSRLLLPAEDPAAESGEQAADVLATRLRALEEMRAASAWLSARPQLGQEIFVRGAPEDLTELDRSRLVADLSGLLRGYIDATRRGAAQRQYRPVKLNYWTVQQALVRLSARLGTMPDWSDLEAFLPAQLMGLERKAAIASTLIASLELARGGEIQLRQAAPFEPIFLSRGDAGG